jgi:diaminopimelate epimerase
MGGARPKCAPMARTFLKMHGLGNDFVVFDARVEPIALTASQVRAIADRKTGVGCDQLIVIAPGGDGADATMRIWNADGGEVEACGNAARCVAQVIGDAVIDTAGGRIAGRVAAGGATIDMGVPRFDWDEIPLAYAIDTRAMPVAWDELQNPAAVNVGNPHAVFFVDDVDSVDIERLGPIIEHDPLFPDRVNVNVASVVDRGRVRLRVWERGVGLTRACGTGACATAVAAMRRGHVDRRVTVSLPGGDLGIEWRDGGHVLMTGPAATAFRGEIDLAAFA